MIPGISLDLWVGREEELSVLKDAVDLLRTGSGTAVWIEGEAGIGKSTLAAKGADFARAAGYEVLAGMADPMSQRSPLNVMVDLLQISPRSPDPRAS